MLVSAFLQRLNNLAHVLGSVRRQNQHGVLSGHDDQILDSNTGYDRALTNRGHIFAIYENRVSSGGIHFAVSWQ
jgi:hypothetical protein